MSIDFTDDAHREREQRCLDKSEIVDLLTKRLSGGDASVSNRARGRRITPITLGDGRTLIVEWVQPGSRSVLVQSIEFEPKDI